MSFKKIILSSLCILIFFASSGNFALAKSDISLKYSSDEIININVYEKLNPAIVSISCELDEGVSSGTGCIIHSNGTILTSSHVIEDAKKIERLTYENNLLKAKLRELLNLNK